MMIQPKVNMGAPAAKKGAPVARRAFLIGLRDNPS